MFYLKKLVIITAAALTIGAAGAVTANGAYMTAGDCNGDGKVDSADASDILAHYAALSSGEENDWTPEMTANCDIDGNGSINAADASAVLEYYAYISTAEGEIVHNIKSYCKGIRRTHLLAPEGLDPGEKDSIKYLVNTEKLTPHDDIVLYNIKENNGNDGKPIYVRTYTVTENDKDILEAFAMEHFTDTMTNYDRIECVWRWLHENVTYADGRDGRPAYSEIWNDSFVEACFVKKAGQCIQYNGAFAEMLAYMGYDTYMLEQWNGKNNTNQHFISEAHIGGKYLCTEVGEKGYDSPPWYYWMWLFSEEKARFHGLEE